MKREKVCSVMDCQKLSQQACAHAAQHDHLPVQTVVQVIYCEQQRLCKTSDDGGVGEDSPSTPFLPSLIPNFGPTYEEKMRGPMMRVDSLYKKETKELK